MKIITQNIPVPPTMPLNPIGEYTHLIRMGFKHEDADEGLMHPTVYLVYNRKDNTIGQITEDGVAELCIAAAFKGAEVSKPTS